MAGRIFAKLQKDHISSVGKRSVFVMSLKDAGMLKQPYVMQWRGKETLSHVT